LVLSSALLLQAFELWVRSGSLGANAAKDQAVSTAEAITAAVRRELSIDPNSIRETLQSSLGSTAASLDLKEIRSQFEQLLSGPEQSIAEVICCNVDRQTFVNLVSSRTDFSKQDINRIADQLEGAWKQVVGQQGQQDPQAILSTFKVYPEELQMN